MRVFLVLILVSLAARAEDWSGRVVGVHDGDTVTVLRDGIGTLVRLDEIDAPELGQAFGREAKKSLSQLCFGRLAEVHEQGRDKYDRLLARLSCAGIDANAEQVRRGLAWFYTRYGHDDGLRALENLARARRVGLWADPRPIPPWEFRHTSSRAASGSGSPCNKEKTCGEFRSCREALFYLHRCGWSRLDRNHDGVPCESLCR
ncbi:thermonuclease family protein [Candidatus Methylocalor cossyra]